MRILFKTLRKNYSFFENLEKNFSVIYMSSYFSFWPKSWSATEILDMPIVSEQVYVHKGMSIRHYDRPHSFPNWP